MIDISEARHTELQEWSVRLGFVSGHLYAPVPIETLTWPQAFFVRLFAPARFFEQRRLVSKMHREAVHELFVTLHAKIQTSTPAYVEFEILVSLLKRPSTMYSSKRRFLMGKATVREVRSMARKQYVPKMLQELKSRQSRDKSPEHFFSQLPKQLMRV